MKKILAIDDEKDFCFFTKKNLERAGYEVFTVSDGKSGIKVAKEQRPDLILLDIMMPGIDGFEVLEILKKDSNTCHIPVVMLTGRDDEESKSRAKKLLNEDYLIKPVEIENLREKVESILGKDTKQK
ncbi:MAG: response regulator [Candidatus Omnitrophica bacterium]|nr:response regulator [Candidatus Omnitrophota bacterium]MDD5430450.1 response regulator [Candidatus Omnitrophota bacterium]